MATATRVVMANLSGPVGKAGRKENPVTNKADDIRMVRAMLRANGFNVPDVGGADGGLIKAILAAQVKAGSKIGDGIIDPDGPVFEYLKPKFEKAQKEAAAEQSQKLVKVTFRGKEYQLLPEDYDDLVEATLDRLSRYIKRLVQWHNGCMSMYDDYCNTAAAQKGYFEAIAQAVIVKAGGVTYPDRRLAGASADAAARLQRAVDARSLKQIDAVLPEAETAINAFTDDVQRFLKEFTGSAGMTVTVLKVGSAACFGIAGALAVPVMVTAGMGATAAAAASSAAATALTSTLGELERVVAGQKVTAWEAISNVAIDTALGAVSAGLTAKIPLGFVDDVAKGIAKSFASKIPGVSAQLLAPAITNFLSGTGQEVIKTAVSEGLGVVGKIVKSGKVPTRADFDDAVEKILITALTAGFLKNLGGFQKKWAFDARDKVENGIIPSVLKTFLKNKKVPPVVLAKMQADVWNAVSGEVTKGGVTVGLKMLGSTDDPDKMSDAAVKALEKDRAIEKLIEKEVEKFLKKEKLM